MYAIRYDVERQEWCYLRADGREIRSPSAAVIEDSLDMRDHRRRCRRRSRAQWLRLWWRLQRRRRHLN